MNYGIVSQEQLEQIDTVLSEKLIKLGVDCVIIIDMAGNIITARDNGESKYDVYSFAALAAGNFATVDAMAKLVGEQEFSLLFHKGQDSNIHFSKIDDELLLISMFGKEFFIGGNYIFPVFKCCEHNLFCRVYAAYKLDNRIYLRVVYYAFPVI